MSILRTTAKTALSGLLHYSGTYGALAWLGERVGHGGLAVLTYHRVLPPEEAQVEPDPGILTTAATFEAQMRLVSRRYSPLTMDEAIRHLESGEPLPRRACMVTFDDGWLDTYAHAFPILRRYGLPATVFVPTSYVGTDKPLWPRVLAEIVRVAAVQNAWPEVHRILSQHGVRSPYASLENAGVKRVLAWLKSLPKSEREPLAAALASALHIPDMQDRWLTWDQLREMSLHGVTVGSHTRTHAILTAEPADEVLREVQRSARDIERNLGVKPLAFCYPDGAWSEQVEATVGQAGHTSAYTTCRGLARRGSSLLHLPRIDMHENVTAGARGRFSTARFAHATTFLPTGGIPSYSATSNP